MQACSQRTSFKNGDFILGCLVEMQSGDTADFLIDAVPQQSDGVIQIVPCLRERFFDLLQAGVEVFFGRQHKEYVSLLLQYGMLNLKMGNTSIAKTMFREAKGTADLLRQTEAPGKMAATYMNLDTGKAMRIVAREDSRQKAKESFPELENKYSAQLEAYKIMSDKELFSVMEVTVRVAPQDMPGRPLRRVKCDSCGEHVQDMREVCQDDKVLCVACAKGGYYVQVRSEFIVQSSKSM